MLQRMQRMRRQWVALLRRRLAQSTDRQAEEEEAERAALERHSTQLAARQSALQTAHTDLSQSHERILHLLTREQTRAGFLQGCVSRRMHQMRVAGVAYPCQH